MGEALIPALIGAAGTLAVLFINRIWARRDASERDTAAVAKARIDDGSLIRRELWDRVEKLEKDLADAHEENRKLEEQLTELKRR